MTRQKAMVGFPQAQNCRHILLHRIFLLVALRDISLPRSNGFALGCITTSHETPHRLWAPEPARRRDSRPKGRD